LALENWGRPSAVGEVFELLAKDLQASIDIARETVTRDGLRRVFQKTFELNPRGNDECGKLGSFVLNSQAHLRPNA